MTALGFPIRESAGLWLFSASPRLIAAVHALHRLLVPRHPPCALPILTVITRSTRKGRTRGDTRSHRPCEAVLRWHDCAVFKVRARRMSRIGTPVSQNSTAWPRAWRGTQARSTLGTGSSSAPRGMRGGPSPALHVLELPRKEVIQPHLPVRLPCYDLAPITGLTLGA